MFGKKQYDVICVGSASQDIFFPTDEGVIIATPEDVTSKEKLAFELGGKVLVADRYESVGGVAANVSQGLSLLGHKVACMSCVGGDELGKWVIKEIKERGVDTTLIKKEAEAKTDLSAIVVMTQNGERTIFHNRDANELLKVAPEDLQKTEWIFVSALNGDWKGNLRQVLKSKEEHHKKFAFNPGQHNIKEDPRLVLEALGKSDVLVLNKDEAAELILQSHYYTKDQDLNSEEFLLHSLSQAGAKIIGMTDGKRGAWGYNGKEFWHCPIHTRKDVIDSTGAGDAFGSGFLGALLSGASLDVALRYGIANSGSVIGFYGCNAGLLDHKTIEKLIEKIIPEKLS
ncbi:MAG: carbohydrate kinase family protein [Patescibacteria group bacterium]